VAGLEAVDAHAACEAVHRRRPAVPPGAVPDRGHDSRQPAREGDPLSDAQLAERFGVSRITVRRAMDELVDAGILYRIQGRGTFVRQNKLREKLTLNSFLDAWTPKAGGFNVRVARSSGCPRTTALPRTSPSGRAPRSSISGVCGCRTRPSSPSTIATCGRRTVRASGG
jgi:regulatory GntR family protein